MSFFRKWYICRDNNSAMSRLIAIFLVFSGMVFTSCVPLSDLIYLQKKDNEQVVGVTPVNAAPYRLKSNDVLSIVIKTIDPKFAEIFNPTPTGAAQGKSEQSLYFDGYKVDDHGNIRMPVLGEINVLGYSLDEVRVKIEKDLLQNHFNPEASVFVTVKLAGFRYTINGEVGSPGTKTLFQEKVNILEAVANSGDITLVGDRKKVMIVRQFPQGTEMHELDLTDAKVMQSPYYYLNPNDYIYVKPLKQKTLGTGKTFMESITSIMVIFSFVTTVLLLTSKI